MLFASTCKRSSTPASILTLLDSRRAQLDQIPHADIPHANVGEEEAMFLVLARRRFQGRAISETSVIFVHGILSIVRLGTEYEPLLRWFISFEQRNTVTTAKLREEIMQDFARDTMRAE